MAKTRETMTREQFGKALEALQEQILLRQRAGIPIFQNLEHCL